MQTLMMRPLLVLGVILCLGCSCGGSEPSGANEVILKSNQKVSWDSSKLPPDLNGKLPMGGNLMESPWKYYYCPKTKSVVAVIPAKKAWQFLRLPNANSGFRHITVDEKFLKKIGIDPDKSNYPMCSYSSKETPQNQPRPAQKKPGA